MTIAAVTLAARRVPAWTLMAAALCAGVFLALAVLVASGATGAIDLATSRLFQSVASGPLDLVANAHTIVGQLAVTLTAAAVLAWIVWRRSGGHAWLAPAAILATGAIELAFKTVLRHAPPGPEFIRAFHNVLGVRVGEPSSFPSGHVARITFLTVLVVALVPGRLSVVVGVAVVAASVFLRVYIGDHWIGDALAGVALGGGVGAAAVAWMRAADVRGARPPR